MSVSIDNGSVMRGHCLFECRHLFPFSEVSYGAKQQCPKQQQQEEDFTEQLH